MGRRSPQRVILFPPWGGPLSTRIGPLDLLRFQLAFTQADLLSPDAFIKAAGNRGVRISQEALLELHRRRALVPLFGIRPRRPPVPIPIAKSAREGYRQYRRPIALVVTAAQAGKLVDPSVTPFWNWSRGMRLPGTQHSTYPTVFYGHHQLLALRPLEAYLRTATWSRARDGHSCSLPPLDAQDAAMFDDGRSLAIVLSALDMQYLPPILKVAHHADAWSRWSATFRPAARRRTLGVSARTAAATAEALLTQARFIDPLGDWARLVRHAAPRSWEQLSGLARLAMDYRIAAEVLLAFVEDLGRGNLAAPPNPGSRLVWHPLDDRLGSSNEDLDAELMDRGLSPYPALLLVLEGRTEMRLMPRVIERVRGRPVPATLIQFADMKTIDRDLDLLVRHIAGPRLSQPRGDVALFARPPTRILVAVDREKKYATLEKQRRERAKLVRRLYSDLPAELQTPQVLRQLSGFVSITTWGRWPWEFANFSDRELATALVAMGVVPSRISERTARAAVRHERCKPAPNIENVWKQWGRRGGSKTRLAELLESVLDAKVEKRIGSQTIERLPAGRVAVQALRTAYELPRRAVAIQFR